MAAATAPMAPPATTMPIRVLRNLALGAKRVT